MNEAQLLDRYTRSDELLQKLVDIAEYNQKKDYEIWFFTYPKDGTRATLAAGTTVLDFDDGTITDTTGAITKMSTSLLRMAQDHMRSIAINVDRDIIYYLDNKDKMPVKADNWFVGTFQNFKKISVITTTSTELLIHACTNPKATMEMQGEATVSVGREEREQKKTAIATHFTTALAQYAAEEENITGLTANEITITGISIYAQQALNLRLFLFGTDGFQESVAADMDDDEFVEFVNLDLATNGNQYNNTGYYYALTDLNIDYEDLDASNELHAALEVIGATGKLASGSGGNLWIKFSYIPRT